MILIGTDEGIYRWIEGAGWPVYHSLQDRTIVGLTSLRAGVLVALDRKGVVLESEDTGLSWRVLPLPKAATSATSVTAWGSPATIVLATKPLNLYQRSIGAKSPSASAFLVPGGAGMGPAVLSRARGMAQVATERFVPSKYAHTSDANILALVGWTPLTPPPVGKDTVASRERGLVVSQTEIRSLAILAGEPATLFASVGGSGLWASDDGGQSWTKCEGMPTEVFGVRPVPGRPGHAWAATQDGARLTTDGGKTWEDRSAGLESFRHVRAIEVKPDAPDTLLAGCAPALGMNSATAASPEGLNFGLFESTNGGKSWSQVKKNFPESFGSDTISDIRFDPAEPDRTLVALGSGEIWATRNGGAYWGPLARQIRAARVLCAIS